MSLLDEQNAASWNETRAAIEAGERLTAAQGLRLFDPECFHEVGRMANADRERRHGDKTFYNINRHLNYTNTCSFACRFCAFHAHEGDDGAYDMSLHDIAEMARNELPDDITELHIVGGAHPTHGLTHYEAMLATLREIRPDVHLKAFSAVELQHFAKLENLPVAEVLARLKAAGLDALPGGGAEVFSRRVRAELCAEKASAEEWLEVHRTAHKMGIPSNATILYGHIETPEERIDHLLRLRELQDETDGIQAIIPLKFHPENTALSQLPRSGGMLDLQMMATCRLILDNVDHVKAYWASLGLKAAQLALSWGANDLDGTVVNEKIYQTAGAGGPVGVGVDSLCSLIVEADREPVERDSLYQPVVR